MEKKKIVLGCDIGNGFAYVAGLTEEGKDPEALFPVKYTRNFARTGGLPSVVYVTPPDGTPLEVLSDGVPANEKHSSDYVHLVDCIKRNIQNNPMQIPGIKAPVSPYDMYGTIAYELVAQANEWLSAKGMPASSDIVFTFPASLADEGVDSITVLNGLQKSIEAQKINGENIRVLGRLPEPAAIAIDFLNNRLYVEPEERRIKADSYTVLVYDLGHGTFDAAVVTAYKDMDPTPYVLHLKDGHAAVGGHDFDEDIFNELVSVLEESHNVTMSPAKETKIRKEVSRIKIELSTADYSVLNFETDDGQVIDVTLTRERFEEISGHRIADTLAIVQGLLDDANAKEIKIDAVVLSGGASQMPMVTAGLRELVDDSLPIITYRFSEAVAYGAAIYGDSIKEKTGPKRDDDPDPDHGPEPHKGDTIITQNTDRAYGLALPDPENPLQNKVRFIIPSGQARPCTSPEVNIPKNGGARISVEIYKTVKAQSPEDGCSPDDGSICKSVLFIPFDVESGKTYKVKLTADENYNIIAELISSDGKTVRKSTADGIEKLLQ